MDLRNKYAFVGVGVTRQGKIPDMTPDELAAQAIQLELAGILRTTTCRYAIPDKRTIAFDRRSGPEVMAKSPDILAFERQRRGPEPLYWEDVAAGMEMKPPLEKGLLTMTEIFRFGTMVPPHLRRIEIRRESVELGFKRESHQKRAGLENASDYGPQRTCWLGQMVTDWMSDAGTLKKLSCQIRHPNIIGDINTIKGKVAGKYVKEREYLVDCDILVENQAGLVTAPGRAIVALPSRNNKYSSDKMR